MTHYSSQCWAIETDRCGLSRTHALLSGCNRILARGTEERALLNAFSDHLVEVGEYGCAWIGYIRGPTQGQIRLMALAGQRSNPTFVGNLIATINAGQYPGACRTACESGTSVILRDLSQPSTLAPWAKAALDQGYFAMIALPLQVDTGRIGLLCIFSHTRKAFASPEAALLAELADDLAYGIQTVRARHAEAQQVRQIRSEAERNARHRFAATLHDGVGQTLQALNLGLKQARAMALRQDGVPVDLLDRLIIDTSAAISELRTVTYELRPLFLDHLSLSEAIRHHCSETAQRTGAAIRVLTPNTCVGLDDHIKEQCFLAFREALSNALRHADPTQVEVVLSIRPRDWLILAIRDNGIGFDTQQHFTRPAGLGLCMIRERAEGVLGHARIRSIIGKGTLVRICVPLSKEQEFLPCP